MKIGFPVWIDTAAGVTAVIVWMTIDRSDQSANFAVTLTASAGEGEVELDRKNPFEDYGYERLFEPFIRRACAKFGLSWMVARTP